MGALEKHPFKRQMRLSVYWERSL